MFFCILHLWIFWATAYFNIIKK